MWNKVKEAVPAVAGQIGFATFFVGLIKNLEYRHELGLGKSAEYFGENQITNTDDYTQYLLNGEAISYDYIIAGGVLMAISMILLGIKSIRKKTA